MFSFGTPSLIVTLSTVPEAVEPSSASPFTLFPTNALAADKFCSVSIAVSEVVRLVVAWMFDISLICCSIWLLSVGFVGSWFCNSVISILRKSSGVSLLKSAAFELLFAELAVDWLASKLAKSEFVLVSTVDMFGPS
jgi:hypothetical protein